MKRVIIPILAILSMLFGFGSFAAGNENSYNYIQPIKISLSNPFLESMIKNEWKMSAAEKALGKADSYFDGYNIYFNKGVSIGTLFDRWTGGGPDSDKVLNIIFNSKYKSPIAKGITTQSKKEEVIGNLGKPQFLDDELHVIGYKSDSFYIFFHGDKKLDEISVYRRDKTDDKEAVSKAVKSLEKTRDFDSGLSDLSIVLGQYDYHYSHAGFETTEFISKGISICKSDEGAPIVIYGNYEGSITDTISLPGKIDGLNQFKSDYIELHLDKDRVFELELQRLRGKSGIEASRKKSVLSPDKKTSVISNGAGTFNSGIYMDAGIFVFSVNRSKADIEYFTGHFPDSRFFWLSNRYVLYSVYLNGLRAYDIQKNKEIVVVNSVDISELVSAKNGRIVYKAYDRNANEHNYSVKYSLNKTGEIQITK